MQITFTKKAGYYGRNRKGISVGAEVMTFNGEIIIRPINTRGVTDSCSIGVGSVADALMLADEIRKQAMAMVQSPDTVCGWLVYMGDAQDDAINEILLSAPLLALGKPAKSKEEAIAIGYEYAPKLFKPLYDRYVADQTAVILQQVVDSKILFSQLQDAYKDKLIADIKSKLTDEWVELNDEFELFVEGNYYAAKEISIEGLNCETSYGEHEIVDFFDMSIDSLEYIQPNITGNGIIELQKDKELSIECEVYCGDPDQAIVSVWVDGQDQGFSVAYITPSGEVIEYNPSEVDTARHKMIFNSNAVQEAIKAHLDTLRKTPDTTPLWDSIPLQYKFVAIDESGDEYAYKEKPHTETPIAGCGNWTAFDAIYPTGRKFNMDLIDWEKTLSVRP